MEGLHVLLFGVDERNALEWLSWNSQWLSLEEDRLTVLIESGKEVQSVILADLDEIIHSRSLDAVGGAVTLDEAVGEIRDRSIERSLLIASMESAARGDWRRVLQKARTLAHVSAATGRWNVTPKGKKTIADLGGIDVIDETPKRIASAVKSWTFSRNMHGVCVRSLPMEFTWIAPDQVKLFLICLENERGLGHAAQIFFNHIEIIGDGVVVYLPNLIVFDQNVLIR